MHIWKYIHCSLWDWKPFQSCCRSVHKKPNTQWLLYKSCFVDCFSRGWGGMKSNYGLVEWLAANDGMYNKIARSLHTLASHYGCRTQIGNMYITPCTMYCKPKCFCLNILIHNYANSMVFSLFTNIVTEKTFEELKISQSFMNISWRNHKHLYKLFQELFNKVIIFLIFFLYW